MRPKLYTGYTDREMHAIIESGAKTLDFHAHKEGEPCVVGCGPFVQATPGWLRTSEEYAKRIEEEER